MRICKNGEMVCFDGMSGEKVGGGFAWTGDYKRLAIIYMYVLYVIIKVIFYFLIAVGRF